MRARATLALGLVFCACRPADGAMSAHDAYARGEWHLNGANFGAYDRAGTPMSYDYYCNLRGKGEGVIDIELALGRVDRLETNRATVTFAPLDDTKPVVVHMPWTNVTFGRSECSERSGTASLVPLHPPRPGHSMAIGTVRLRCANKDDAIDLSMTYACQIKATPGAH